jgi:hypothetical protein
MQLQNLKQFFADLYFIKHYTYYFTKNGKLEQYTARS